MRKNSSDLANKLKFAGNFKTKNIKKKNINKTKANYKVIFLLN